MINDLFGGPWRSAWGQTFEVVTVAGPTDRFGQGVAMELLRESCGVHRHQNTPGVFAEVEVTRDYMATWRYVIRAHFVYRRGGFTVFNPGTKAVMTSSGPWSLEEGNEREWRLR